MSEQTNFIGNTIYRQLKQRWDGCEAWGLEAIVNNAVLLMEEYGFLHRDNVNLYCANNEGPFALGGNTFVTRSEGKVRLVKDPHKENSEFIELDPEQVQVLFSMLEATVPNV